MHFVGTRADSSAVLRVSCAVALLTTCTASTPAPTESAQVSVPPSSVATAYYVESQGLEPRAPTPGGSPSDWESRAKQGLSAAGLRPQTVAQLHLRSTLRDPIIGSGCPSGFVLVIVVPSADIAGASARCFVTAEPNFNGPSTADNKPASTRTDCRPLYPKQG